MLCLIACDIVVYVRIYFVDDMLAFYFAFIGFRLVGVEGRIIKFAVVLLAVAVGVVVNFAIRAVAFLSGLYGNYTLDRKSVV